VEYRAFGSTGLEVSALGFGCGDVGGLIVRGSPAERLRAIERAIELGITYFDTAPSYGSGLSEQHLGDALRTLDADVVVGTKFRLVEEHAPDVVGAVARSLEESLKRLGRDQVDLLQLHDAVTRSGDAASVSSAQVLADVVPALEQLRQQGKVRQFGITGRGDAAALREVVSGGGFATVQTFLNLLNPSAAIELPAGFPAHDFELLLVDAQRAGMGAIGVRALAGGALSGSPSRQPLAMQDVAPIGTGRDYAADVRRAGMLAPLIAEGHVESLVEAALRFPLALGTVSTVLVGYSDLEQLDYAAACVAKGPLTSKALDRTHELWNSIASQ
jgi:aryl-alcohol dehydrogenase-like predicted oxidoreductase